MCVCVCERERERERGKWAGPATSIRSYFVCQRGEIALSHPRLSNHVPIPENENLGYHFITWG